MKISYYQFLNEDKQKGRDDTWAKYGRAIKERTRTYGTNGTDLIHPFDRDDLIIQTMRSHGQTMHHTSTVLGNPQARAGFFAKTGVPEHILRPYIEKQVQEYAPHPKYERVMTRWLANGSIAHIEDLQMVGEALQKHQRLVQAGVFTGPHAETQMWRINHPDMQYQHSEFSDDNRWSFAEPYNYRYRPELETKTIKNADFNSFPTWRHLKSVVDEHSSRLKEAQVRIEQGKDYHIVHEDDDVVVYHPLNHAAARKLSRAGLNCEGNRAHWCTATESPTNFVSYSRSGPLLIFKPKNPIDEQEIYQSHPSQTMNFSNRHSNFLDVENPRFPGFDDNKRKQVEASWRARGGKLVPK